MKASRPSEGAISERPVEARPRSWWRSPLLLSLSSVCGAQLLPFAFGPLTECGHCVANYLRLYPLIPASFVLDRLRRMLREWFPTRDFLDTGNLVFGALFPGLLIVVAIFFALTFLTAMLKRPWTRSTWLLLVMALAAVQALGFARLLRS